MRKVYKIGLGLVSFVVAFVDLGVLNAIGQHGFLQTRLVMDGDVIREVYVPFELFDALILFGFIALHALIVYLWVKIAQQSTPRSKHLTLQLSRERAK